MPPVYFHPPITEHKRSTRFGETHASVSVLHSLTTAKKLKADNLFPLLGL